MMGQPSHSFDRYDPDHGEEHTAILVREAACSAGPPNVSERTSGCCCLPWTMPPLLKPEDGLERLGRQVAPFPLEFTENHFGSLLTLSTRLGPGALHRRMTATYGNSSWGLSTMITSAPYSLEGEAAWAEDGTVIIFGRWVIPGNDTREKQMAGVFEMCLDLDSNQARGWCEMANSPRQRWVWHSSRSGPSVVGAWRARTNGPWIDYFSLVSAWLFLLLTALTLAGFVADSGSYLLTCFCVLANAELFLHSVCFLCLFTFMAHAPPTNYTLGVYNYTIGYLAFTLLYLASMMQHPSIATRALISGLYNGGSFMFMVGSLFLLRVFPVFGVLWWGSMCFAVGSCCFVRDALQLCTVDLDCGLPDASRTLNLTGLILFLIGRICFVLGSETSRLDLFFRERTAPTTHHGDPEQDRPQEQDVTQHKAGRIPQVEKKRAWVKLKKERREAAAGSLHVQI
eukprot:TRINITY_DN3949_c0_g1_i1.p1 TRINITY_DN3949_c0_g1~~TRINITY_DN3949_c0_g1_i1.p1  ORF type:complete len:455 (-),score=69.51 TRINITY_DN3949_c0_g1_i1:274-1638(-)